MDILVAARALIADPSRWHRGGYAFGRVKEVKPLDKQARRWCALGAIWKVIGRNPKHAETCGRPGALLAGAAWRLYGRPTDRVNDRDGHAAVLEIYDAAIEDARTEFVS